MTTTLDAPPAKPKRRRIDTERVRELAAQGLTDAAIAAQLQCSLAGVRLQRKQHDIPAGKPRPAKVVDAAARRATVVPLLPTEWQEQAECRNADPELFHHPEGERSPTLRAERDAAAAAVCAACHVASACRAWAKTTRQKHGVWAGQCLECIAAEAKAAKAKKGDA